MKTVKKIKILLISMGLIVLGVSTVTGQDTADYFLGHGFAGTGDTVFTNSGTFWDDGYTSNYDQDADWDVYFCTTDGNPNPLTLEFTGFKTHYGGETLPGPYADWDYIKARYDPSVHYNVYNDDTPEFSLTSQNGCIRITMITNGDALTHEGWQAEIYAIPPPTNNDPCGAEYLQAGNVCTPQVFSNKGAFSTGSYPGPCHPYFGGDVWFTAVVPSSGTLKIESFTGTLEWAVMDLFRGSSCAGLTRFACIEDSIGMPTAILESSSIPGLSIGDTVYIRMYGDQAKSGTFGMCASDPTAEIEGHTGPGGVGDDSTNVIWLRADLGTLNSSDAAASNGEGIKTWEDQSGNQNHVVQAAGGQQPLLSNNGINSMPSITYDGSDDYMMAELSTLSAPLTLFTVSKFTDAGADDYLISMGDEISDDKTVSISRDADSLYYAYTNNSEWYGPTLNTHTPYLLHAVHNIASTYHELYINETAQSPADYSTSVVTDGSLRLGSSRNTTNFFGGDIAEFIIYKQILNSAQKIIVENFLAAKYGLSITTDRFSHKPGHKYDVSGIGQVNPSNQHTEAQSAKTLAIGNPTNLDDGEFLMFGHDNGDITSWTSTERPNNDPNVKRIEREWRVDITGDPGSLTITLSDSILPDLLPGFNNYALWTDADGNFSSGAQAIPLVKVDNDYVANSVNLIDNVYITIGTIMPQVSFTQDSSEALESVEFPNIEVSLNYAVNEEISVVFRAIDGTATGGGVDYLLNPGSAVFPAGIKTVNIQPQIVDDTIVEIPDEDFYIRLSDPDPGLILSADSIHTYTILNNDINVSVSTSTDTISDCGTASANISTTVEGTGPYNFVWTPAGGLSDDEIANPVASPAADTWYKVTVTDQTNAAVGMDSIHITVIAKPIKPDITTVGITTFCEGDSVQLSSSAGFSWQWSNGETTRVIYAKTTGSYTVNVIDEFGCASEPSDAEPVTVNPKPATPTMLASGDTDICPGDSVDLTSSDGDNYIWSTGESTKTIRIKTAGNYYVQTQTADGCKSDTSLVTPVTIKTPPDAPTVTASGPTDFCLGDSVDLESS
ncbi:MAG TPA: hypothetical protein ENI20_02835, partial [Bacteroides sp.]|nr:hypothetical protein [Bacteroides sp.]